VRRGNESGRGGIHWTSGNTARIRTVGTMEGSLCGAGKKSKGSKSPDRPAIGAEGASLATTKHSRTGQ